MLGFTSELIFEEKKTYTLADIILHKYIDVLHNVLHNFIDPLSKYRNHKSITPYTI